MGAAVVCRGVVCACGRCRYTVYVVVCKLVFAGTALAGYWLRLGGASPTSCKSLPVTVKVVNSPMGCSQTKPASPAGPRTFVDGLWTRRCSQRSRRRDALPPRGSRPRTARPATSRQTRSPSRRSSRRASCVRSGGAASCTAGGDGPASHRYQPLLAREPTPTKRRALQLVAEPPMAVRRIHKARRVGPRRLHRLVRAVPAAAFGRTAGHIRHRALFDQLVVCHWGRPLTVRAAPAT